MAEMNPLRRRMIEDMKVRNLSPRTQRCYVHAVAKFAQHFNRSPDRLGLAEIRAYQIHLTSTGTSWAGFNVAVCALQMWAYLAAYKTPHDDPAELIRPLHATRPHLATTHPDLAAQLDTLTHP